MNRPFTSSLTFLLLFLATNLLLGQIASIKFDKFPSGERGLAGDYFTEVVQDNNGFIWLGGQPGLFRFDGYEFQSFHELTANGHIRFLYADSKGLIWVSTFGGLSVFDPIERTTMSFFFNKKDSLSLSHPLPEPILEDNEGTIWIGTVNGLDKFNHGDQNFTSYYFQEDRIGKENFIVRMQHDRFDDNFIWLATNRGLQRFNKALGTFEIFKIPFSWPTANLESGRYTVLGVHQDLQGVIWIGLSTSNDLVRFDPKNNEWNKYAVPSDKIFNYRRTYGMYSMLDKSEDELWIACVAGTGSFNKSTHTFDLFELNDTKDGTPMASVSRKMLIDRRGYLWLPALDGLSRSREPVQIPTVKPEKRSVHLTDFKITGRSLPPIDQTNSLLSFSLGRSDNSFTVKFCTPVPGKEEEVVYATRLLGNEKEWIEQGSQRFREFSGLSGGKYSLEVKAHEGDEDWGNVLKVPIEIERGWWETLWFKFLVLLGILSLIALFQMIRRRHQKRERRLKEEYQNQLAQVQMEALRAQMNPHFLFNTLNSINHYILKNDSAEASSYLTKFSRLIRPFFNSKSQTVRVRDELDALKLYIDIERLRFKDEFEYEINIDPAINQDQISIPPMLIQPYVENAIWHGLMHKEGDRKLDVSILVDDQHLIISVKDNGIGREASKEFQDSLGKKNSLGMQITKDRVSLVNKLYKMNTEIEIIDLYDQNDQAKGTEVLVTIPLMGTPAIAQMHNRN